MECTPAPTSLAAALALPRTPGRSAEVFVDGDLEVRFAAKPTNGPQVPHQRDELYFVAAGDRPLPGRGRGDRGRRRRRAVLRGARAAWLRGYLGRLLRLGVVLRPHQATALKSAPCSWFARYNMPAMWAQRCLSRPMVERDNAEGGRLSPPNAASRGGPTDRRSGDPRCGTRDGVSGHMARGCVRAPGANAARAFHATRDAASRPVGPLARPARPSADAAHP